MAAPGTGTCAPWATAGDVCSPCDDYEFSQALLDDALQVASDVLYDLTGRRWPGECTDTVRPAGCDCRRMADCCLGPSQVRLPGYPVTDVDQVKVDGEVISAARYEVQNHRWLVYLPDPDDEATPIRRWPTCQRLDRATTEDRTFEVTYTYGTEPPVGGRLAAASLGCQLALACQPETVGQCRLPKRVTQISRQGVTVAALIDNMQGMLSTGDTGLPEVNLWVASVNLGRARRPAKAYVPGRGRMARRTTSA